MTHDVSQRFGSERHFERSNQVRTSLHATLLKEIRNWGQLSKMKNDLSGRRLVQVPTSIKYAAETGKYIACLLSAGGGGG